MGRNFGFSVDEATRHDEEKRVEFWTGFITGGVSAAFSLALLIVVAVWMLPN